MDVVFSKLPEEWTYGVDGCTSLPLIAVVARNNMCWNGSGESSTRVSKSATIGKSWSTRSGMIIKNGEKKANFNSLRYRIFGDGGTQRELGRYLTQSCIATNTETVRTVVVNPRSTFIPQSATLCDQNCPQGFRDPDLTFKFVIIVGI